MLTILDVGHPALRLSLQHVRFQDHLQFVTESALRLVALVILEAFLFLFFLSHTDVGVSVQLG